MSRLQLGAQLAVELLLDDGLAADDVDVDAPSLVVSFVVNWLSFSGKSADVVVE